MPSIDEGYVEFAAPNSGWTVIAATGAVTVLSFVILAEYFPQEVSGRANAALNLLHVGAAFVLQSAMGIIIAQWPLTNGGYAVAAHEAAMTAGICVQLLALGWFALPRRGALLATQQIYRFHPLARLRYPTLTPARYAAIPSRQHERLLRQHAVSWRLAAVASTMLCTGLSTALWAATAGRSNPIQVFAVDQSMLASAWHQAVPPSVGAVGPSATEAERFVGRATPWRVANTNLRRRSNNSQMKGPGVPRPKNIPSPQPTHNRV